MAKGLLPRVDRLVRRWRLAAFLGMGWVGLAGTGCGDLGPAPAAHPITGGGVGSGNDPGVLNVYVTDEDQGSPIQGARVQVARSGDPSPCTALTDSTGLATFDGRSCPWRGAVMLTASIAGYAPTTWVGVSGSNLTVPIRAVARPTEPTATVTGTIDLWGALPLATGNHQLLAIVMASAPPGSDDVEEIGQGTRSVHMLRGSATANVPANVCLRTTLIDDCHWQLATRPGPQAHFAVIIDQDTNGTSDPLDDTNTVIAYAVKTGVAPIAGSVSTGEVLERIADRDLQDFSAAFPILPPEMAQLAAFPILNLGKAGRITIAVPALDFRHPTTRVPKPVGRLAGMTYDLDARAQSANAEIEPTTESWVRDAKVSDTVAVPDWLPPPSGVSATRGIYGFTAVPGATLHAAELQNASSGARLWSVTIFDGSTSFTLPDLAPDPLPPGTVKLQVSALAIPGINLEAIALHDAMQKRTARSTAALTFRR